MGNLAELNFDAEKVEPSQDFAPIPAGEYVAMAIGSEFKTTASGNGEYLQFCWEVIDGEHKGRRLWDRLNLHNPSETAVKIAQGTLSAICRSVGVMRPKDSSELHNKPVMVKVALEERNDKAGEFRNVVKGYASANGGSPAPAQAAAPAADKTPPWKRKA
jgi:Protein of unknown function (DUF669)